MAKSKASKKEKSKALKKDSTPTRAKTYIFTAKEALSAESISCLMLTSDCLQSEKEDTMLAWEE